MSRFFSLVLLVVLLVSAATAGITINEGTLAKAKRMPEQVVLIAIAKADLITVDTSDEGLAQFGLSQKVIAALQLRALELAGNQTVPNTTDTRPASDVSANTSKAENGGYPQSEGVYYRVTGGKWVKVLSGSVIPNVDTGNGFMTVMNPFGKNAVKQIFNGKTAPTRIRGENITFCVVGYGLSPRNIKVFVLEQKEDRRELQNSTRGLRSVGVKFGPGKGKTIEPDQTHEVQEGVVIAEFRLADGEYAIDYNGVPNHDFSVYSGGQQIASN